MTHPDQIQQIEKRLGVELERLAIDELDTFEHYSPKKKRAYIVDAEDNVVAFALDGEKAFEISSVEELISLRKLSLRDVPLTSEALGTLSTLAQVNFLDLSGTLVSDLSVLESLPRLTSLCLRNCKELSLSTLKGPVSLHHLDLGRNNLGDLRPLRKLRNLQVLHLKSNEASTWPTGLELLTTLLQLDLSQTELGSLPPEVGKLTNLRTLSLDGSQLSELPPEVGKLTNLETLSLDGNQLTELPPEVGKLTNLRTLSLAGNQLSELPPEVCNLAKLRTLNLGGSELALTTSNLAGNQFREMGYLVDSSSHNMLWLGA